MKVFVKNARLSFADLFKPKSFEGSGDEKYSANLLIEEDTKFIIGGKEVTLKKLKKVCDDLYAEKTGKKVPKAGFENWFLNKADGSTTRKAYVNRKTDDYYAGVGEDTWYVSGSKKAEDCKGGKLLVVDQAKNPVEQSDGSVYSGCYVNAIFDVYAYNGKMSKGVTASIEGVQKVRDGDRLGGETINALDEFDEIEGEDLDVEVGDDDDDDFE